MLPTHSHCFSLKGLQGYKGYNKLSFKVQKMLYKNSILQDFFITTSKNQW